LPQRLKNTKFHKEDILRDINKTIISTLTNWSGTGFFFFFTPPPEGERRKIHLFPLGIQGKNKWIFRKCQSRIINNLKMNFKKDDNDKL